MWVDSTTFPKWTNGHDVGQKSLILLYWKSTSKDVSQMQFKWEKVREIMPWKSSMKGFPVDSSILTNIYVLKKIRSLTISGGFIMVYVYLKLKLLDIIQACDL